MIIRKVLAVVSLIFLLAGCNVTNQYYEEVEAVGKQIVADWRELPEVKDASYEYRHGLDQGQLLFAYATVPAASVTSVAVQLEEIARRDYWRGTSLDVTLYVRIYSDANPPVQGQSNLDKIVHDKQIEFDDAAELEKKYGPRPKKK
ncbi:hypothetical protein FXN61_38230 [Lentzea sp. PSKA42]|jgi:hypothetical protein|uniref:Lipoprotein n=1 Tax=Lentzea indica TaxID=2604800 RepID=A0ABX1FTA6_9PSEU|nr:hypothetical protein [Lentzea indica]NKE62271.1 hypothetical protein [Lentzea indica]